MISICIPTYLQKGQGPAMLRVLLASIRMQIVNFPFEVVISDNDTTGLIKKACDQFKDLPIKYHFNPVSGASENINNAIDLCAYDKIKLMCQDDKFMLPQALQLFSEALDGAGWVISDSARLNERGQLMGVFKTAYDHSQFKRNTVGMPSVIGWKKCALRFDVRLKTFCDLYFYYQLYDLYGPPAVIEKPVVAQRFWKGSLSHNQPPSHDADRFFLIKNGLIHCQIHTIVAVVVYNRVENVKKWLKAWAKADTTVGTELVILHNWDDGNATDEMARLCREASVTYVPRQNRGYDIGAFQDVCRGRLPGFPRSWDYLLWVTDDTIPVVKDFITPFLNRLHEPGVGLSCMQISDEITRHVRTTGFCIKKATADRLTFPADPITNMQQCLAFEYRSPQHSLMMQIKKQGLTCVQVAPLKESPLFDQGFWVRNEKALADPQRFDRMDEYAKEFEDDL